MSHLESTPARGTPTRSTMRRCLAAAATAGALLAATPAIARAMPPTHQPPANTTTELHLAAGEVPCGPITLTVTDGERLTTFSTGVVLVTGQLSIVVTSDLTGKSVSLHVSGPGKLFPDGSVKGGGPWLLFGTEVLAFAVGRISIPVGGDVNQVSVEGRRVDLCPMLGL